MKDEVTTIQIKNRYTGDVIFVHKQENNTLRKTIERAVQEGKSLAHAELSEVDLSWFDLSHADFTNADLRGADFSHADLTESNFYGADLAVADLSRSNLTGVRLDCASLRSADLTEAKLEAANLDKTDFEGAVVGVNDNVDGYGPAVELLSNLSTKYGLKVTKFTENHNALSSMQGAIWKNLIVIQEWEIAKDGNGLNLLDKEKAVIKAFAELHGVTELMHIKEKFMGVYYSRFSCCYRSLEMDRLVEELQSDRLYTLEELGIQ